MPLDDLDEKLFADELSIAQIERQHQPAVSGVNKRRTWRWKHTLSNSIDEEDVIGKTHSSSSLESSRRGSICSSHSSPSKSPKKMKDQSKKATSDNTDETNQRMRKDQKEKNDTVYGENRLSAGARLYSVLEEQALGEAVRDSVENLCIGSNRPMSFCTSAALSTNTWY